MAAVEAASGVRWRASCASAVNESTDLAKDESEHEETNNVYNGITEDFVRFQVTQTNVVCSQVHHNLH